jgi:hypothetical protein
MWSKTNVSISILLAVVLWRRGITSPLEHVQYVVATLRKQRPRPTFHGRIHGYSPPEPTAWAGGYDMAGERGPRKVPVELPESGATVYANAKVKRALEELSADMTMYHGVRFAEVAEAIYEQGRVDGRREVFEVVDEARARPELKSRNPGRPTKFTTKKAAAKKRT